MNAEHIRWDTLKVFRYWDGVMEFTVVDDETSLIYGAYLDDFEPDTERVFSCWELPPSGEEPDFLIREGEIPRGSQP